MQVFITFKVCYKVVFIWSCEGETRHVVVVAAGVCKASLLGENPVKASLKVHTCE